MRDRIQISPIIGYIPNEPNQAVIDSLSPKKRIETWKYWLKILTKETEKKDTGIEVEPEKQQKDSSHSENKTITTVESLTSSTAGGFNINYNRLKETGPCELTAVSGLLIGLDKELKDLGPEARVCARIFIPNNLPEKIFITTLRLFSKVYGFEVEYAYPQEFEGKNGYIALIGKNGKERKTRPPILSLKDLQAKQKKFEQNPVEIKPSNEYKEINPIDLNDEQKLQLAYYWAKHFGPGYLPKIQSNGDYELTAVEEILNNPNILKTIMVDNSGNVIAACTGEPDGLGGIEITEFFSKNTFNNDKAGLAMLSLMIKKCKATGLKIYMEANLSSGMAYTALNAGFVIPELEGVEQIARANVKVGGFSNNLSDSESHSYNNFIVLVYPN